MMWKYKNIIGTRLEIIDKIMEKYRKVWDNQRKIMELPNNF